MSDSLEQLSEDEKSDFHKPRSERNSQLLDYSNSFVDEEIQLSSTPIPCNEGHSHEEEEDTGVVYTWEEALDRLGVGGYQLTLFLYCGLTWLSGGMNIMSVPIISASVKCQWHLSGMEESLLSFLTLVGCFLGLVFWTRLNQAFGYRIALAFANVIVLLFRALGALKLTPDDAHLPGYTWLLFCQLAVGFGASGIFQALVFLQHFLPQKSQLPWSLCVTAWWGVGAVLAAVLAAIMMGYGRFTWHMYSGLLGGPSVVLVGLTLLLPESPLHHMAKGKHKEAEKTLKWIARLNHKELPKAGLLYKAEEECNTQKSCGKLCSKSNHFHCLSLLEHIWSSTLFSEQMWKRSIPVGVLWLTASWIYFYGVFLSVSMLKLKPECKKFKFDVVTFPGIHSSLNNTLHFEVFDATTREVCPAGTWKLSNYVNLVWIYGAELPDFILLALMVRVIGPKLSMSATMAVTMIGVTLLFLCTSEKRLTAFLVFIRIFSSVFIKAMHAHAPQVYPKTSRDVQIRYSAAMFLLGALLAPLFSQLLLEASIVATVTIYAGACLVTVFTVLLLSIDSGGKKRLLKV